MKFLVRYFELINTSQERKLLGEELLVNIEEHLAYHIEEDKKIFFNKKFSSSNCYRWEILDIEDTENSEYNRILHVLLANKFDKNEEFLSQTLKKNKKAGHGGIGRLLYKGKIVEVEYGHPFQVYKVNKQIGTNKRYSSTLQGGEMNKRRLAIVVKVQSRGQVQVVPITSKTQPETDKSCFILEKSTLEKTVYFSEDITSWAVCSMIQTVSTTRILPVEIQARHRKKGDYPRDNRYILNLSKMDLINFDLSLLHAINLSKYQEISEQNNELRLKLATSEAEISKLKLLIQDIEKYKVFCEKEGIDPDEYA